MQSPFDDTTALYSGYSSYNNWASKVPSPLGAKSFPWPSLNSVNVNPLAATAQSMSCFNTSNVTASMQMQNVNPTNPCPYGPTTPSPYVSYRSAADQCSNAMSASSIATLRLKAKQHSGPFGSMSYSPMSPSTMRQSNNNISLSPCQYGTGAGGGGIGVGVGAVVSSADRTPVV